MVPRTERRAVLTILTNGLEQVSEEGHGVSTRGYTKAWRSSHRLCPDEGGASRGTRRPPEPWDSTWASPTTTTIPGL